MASSLTPTFGMFFLALFLQAILFGMGLLQVYLYFFWYHHDTWFIKGSVILITCCETFQMGMIFSAGYAYLIDGFGNFHGLTLWNWQIICALLGVYLSTLVAQIYFANCIYQLQRKDKIIPTIIVVFALVCFGSGIAQIVRNFGIAGFHELKETMATRTIQAVFALACDIVITAALCWRLNMNRTGIQSTNVVLNYLIITAVNRGFLTMLSAALNIILFSAKPGTFYFMLWVLLSGKFYMNSMLATLNTRNYAGGLLGKGAMADHISMSTLSGNRGTGAHGEINVSVTTEQHNDPVDGKKFTL